jgi:integrase
VSAAVEAFLASKQQRGLAPLSIESAEDRLRMLLGPVWNRSLRSIADRGEELYAAARVYPADHRRAGELRAVDTHLNALAVAKDWGAWCRKQRWIRANPFAEVEGVGRRVVGADKERLTVDESRRLQAYCHEHAEDLGAVLALGYLLLGPRASELVRHDVRDVDDGGRLLWIRGTKSRSARRRLLVPDELAPYLVAIAAGRAGDEPLFLSDTSGRWPAGRRWTRHMAYLHVRRVCAAAGVPELAPQALRRTQATLAEDAGATGLQVAQHLGHEVGKAPAVTHRAYVGRDAARDAQVERGLRVLQGGRR